MSAGALNWAQITKVVYGAKDDKRGYTILKQPMLHPKTTVVSGIKAEDCGGMVTRFFNAKRNSK